VITSSTGRVWRAATFTPTDTWESPKTHIRYPVAWRIEAEGLKLEVQPHFRERELPILGDHRFIWEGPCRTTPPGRGFQELVGFAQEQKKP
jgi:predicted secreted hydrolase